MKNKIVLISLLILTIFMLSSVSATDDISVDNLTADESSDDIQQDDVNLNADILTSEESNPISTGNKDSGMYLIHDDEYIADDLYEDSDEYWITVKFPQKVSGNLSCFIDNKYVKDKIITAKTHYFAVNLKDFDALSYGEHEIEIKYTGNNDYSSKSIKETFNVTYTFNTYYDESSTYYGNSVLMEISLPSSEGYLNYTINGKKYSKKPTESYETIELPDLKLGNNTIVLSYEDDHHPLKTVSEVISVMPVITGSEEVSYGNDAEFTLILPQDAKGNLHAFIYGDWNDTTDSFDKITIQKVPLKDGKATCTYKNLLFGDNEINLEYDGDDYEVEPYENYVRIIPDVNYSEKIGENTTNNKITFNYPNNITGEIEVTITALSDDNEEDPVIIETLNVKNEGNTEITLPKLDAGDYDVSWSFGSEYLTCDGSYYLKVLNTNPNETLDAAVKSQQIYNFFLDYDYFNLPEEADGKLILIIDGEIIGNVPVEKAYDFNLDKIGIGTHNFELQYVNDTYYKSTSIKSKINVSYFIVNEKISSHDTDGIYVYLPEDATGYVNLKIDGKQYAMFYKSNDRDNQIQLNNLSYGIHSYEITYSGDKKYVAETKTGTFEFDYNLGIYLIGEDEESGNEFNYGHAEFSIELPTDATGNATVYIDGEKIKTISEFYLNHKDMVLIAYFNLPDLTLGKHTALVSYSDSTHPLKTAEHNFTITNQYKIDYPYSFSYKEDWNTNITLILPPNAKGNLVVNINGEEKTVPLVNGHATYSLSDLTPGFYNITAYYNGNDYKVEEVDLNEYETFTVSPSISTENYGTYIIGQNNTISIEIQKEAKGKFNAIIKKEDIEEIYKKATVQLVNGKGELSLSDLPFGSYLISFEYVGDDLNIPEKDEYIYITPINESIPYDADTTKEYVATIELPKDANGKLSVKFNNKAVDASMNNGLISIPLKNIKIGDNELIIDYKDNKYGNLSTRTYITGIKAPAEISIDNPVTSGDKTTLNIELTSNATGKILVSVNNAIYEKTLTNGKASITIPKLNSGNADVIVSYSGDEKYLSSSLKETVQIPQSAKIVASDLAMLYSDGSKYSVKVYDTTGKLASGVSVVFKIDGKKVGSANTTAKGVATLKLTQTPKTYKISAEALGVNITKKLTVKHILTVKKVNVKKSAKKLVLTATLKKIKGKYLKNKKITFKFNGKTYKAKTNKKGIAKVTIKSTVLKKLKVGKKITYQATYLKDTVKKSINVKK